MRVELRRYYQNDTQTRGLLSVFDEEDLVYQCYTIELPWIDNENNVSCVPTGEYTLHHRSAEESGSFDYPHFILQDVPGRSYICIHRGNLYTQILGCVLPGQEFVDINDDGHPDVVDSKETLSALRSTVPDGAPIEIMDCTDVGDPIIAPVAEPDLSEADIEVPDILARP